MNRERDPYWTAFYTKPRNEKKSADRLASKGYQVYCPTRTVLKQWSDRKKKVVEPVFSSYLFAKVDDAERLEILKDSGIVSNVRWLGKPAVIRDNEIREINNFLNDYPAADVLNNDYLVGDHVTVETGALSGNSGVVRKIKKGRVVISIVSLGIEISAEIGLNHLIKEGDCFEK
ncbi:UpxY family transcription antiterminator [Roseivirga echinicomitans]|uniref:NusG-like N-terminal domain-containing protein n=1 Tax=Roseivirga echinicomitans TaxID=296218 RepID=A0A150XR78_9BACT|nr:UpxY family transcription antiterminator [Roseivirga echinicomitans]KYG81145.1 hypothetical protein AWN68_16545 [Roseivirga echinicomitans]